MSADDMLRNYNKLAANLDPAVKAVLAPIVGELATGVKTFHGQQAIDAQKWASAEQTYRLAYNANQKAKGIAFARWTAAMDLQIAAFYSQAPGGDPNVENDQGFLGNVVAQAAGSFAASRDFAVGLAVGLYDVSVVLTNPLLAHSSGSYERLNDQRNAFMAGVEENGWGDQLNMTLNPVYHLIDAGAATLDARNRGDFYQVGQGVVHVQVAVIETALIVAPGAGLAISGGVKIAALASRTATTITAARTVAASRAAGLATDAGAVQLPGRAVSGAEAATSAAEASTRVIASAEAAVVDTAAYSGLTSKVIALSERNITNSGQTVLGSFPRYIEVAKARSASYFDIGEAWRTLKKTERTAVNNHFLDTRMAAGDQFYLTMPKGSVVPGSALADEIAYLTRPGSGYQWVNQWSLRKVS